MRLLRQYFFYLLQHVIQTFVIQFQIVSNGLENGHDQTVSANGATIISENCTSHSFRYQILAAIVGRYTFYSYSI